MRLRILLVKNRLYQMLVGSTTNAFSDEDVKTMFDSFKLTAK